MVQPLCFPHCYEVSILLSYVWTYELMYCSDYDGKRQGNRVVSLGEVPYYDPASKSRREALAAEAWYQALVFMIDNSIISYNCLILYYLHRMPDHQLFCNLAKCLDYTSPWESELRRCIKQFKFHCHTANPEPLVRATLRRFRKLESTGKPQFPEFAGSQIPVNG